MTQSDTKTQTSFDSKDAFIELRIMFDSLESTALRYFFNRKGEDIQRKKYVELKKDLFPVIEKLREGLANEDDRDPVAFHCIPEFFHCGDMCVPYNCLFETPVLPIGGTES